MRCAACNRICRLHWNNVLNKYDLCSVCRGAAGVNSNAKGAVYSNGVLSDQFVENLENYLDTWASENNKVDTYADYKRRNWRETKQKNMDEAERRERYLEEDCAIVESGNWLW